MNEPLTRLCNVLGDRAVLVADAAAAGSDLVATIEQLRAMGYVGR